jgi:hypothetical protein
MYPRDCAIAETHTDTLITRMADDLNIDFIIYSLPLSLSGSVAFNSILSPVLAP